MPDFSAMPLGKLPASRDIRTLKLEDYIDLAALPDPIPENIDYTTKVAQWPMFLNDKLGCCVVSAMAHHEEADSAENGREVTITDADVLAAYEAIGGYVPGNPATDNGLDPLLALKYWRTTGIAGHKIGAFAQVDPTNDVLVKAALHLFGGLFTGLGLPITAKAQAVWDVVGDGKTGNSTPYSWGGHMVEGLARSGSGPYTVITWGFKQPMTAAFLAAYSAQEVFVVISEDWINGTKPAPNGLNMAQLIRDLAIVSGQPDPGPPAPTPPPPAPPWTPDPYATRAFDWQKTVSAYLAGAYAGGDVTNARAWQANLAAFAPQFAAYLAGKAASAPELPAMPGGGA